MSCITARILMCIKIHLGERLVILLKNQAISNSQVEYCLASKLLYDKLELHKPLVIANQFAKVLSANLLYYLYFSSMNHRSFYHVVLQESCLLFYALNLSTEGGCITNVPLSTIKPFQYFNIYNLQPKVWSQAKT